MAYDDEDEGPTREQILQAVASLEMEIQEAEAQIERWSSLKLLRNDPYWQVLIEEAFQKEGLANWASKMVNANLPQAARDNSRLSVEAVATFGNWLEHIQAQGQRAEFEIDAKRKALAQTRQQL